MTFRDTVAVTITAIQQPGAASKEKLLVDPAELIVPEPIHVKDIGGKEFGGDTARQILEALSDPTST